MPKQRITVEGRVISPPGLRRLRKSRRWLAYFVFQPDDPSLPLMHAQKRGNTSRALREALYVGAHVRCDVVVRAVLLADVVSIESVAEPIRCRVAR